MKEIFLCSKPTTSLNQGPEKNVSDLTFNKVTLKTGIKAGVVGGPSGANCGGGSTVVCKGSS